MIGKVSQAQRPADYYDALAAWYAVGAFVGTWLVSIVPLYFATYPPLFDYPFHLARIHILKYWQTSQALQSWYEIRSFLLPNVGMDLIALGLATMVPVAVAGRLFLALILGIILSGCMILHRCIHGYWSWWPLVSALFLFNWILRLGFLNYLLGVGLMLWAAASWIAVRRSSWWLRFLCGTLWAVALFFCHLAAMGLYAIFVAGYELQQSANAIRTGLRIACRDLLVGASIFVIPLLLFMMSSTTSGVGHPVQFNYYPWWNRFAAYRTLESGYAIADGVALVVLVLAILSAAWYGRLHVAKAMALPLGMLLVVHLVIPTALFSAYMVDTRLPVAILFMTLSSLHLILWSKTCRRVLLASLGIALIIHSIVIAYEWHRNDRILQAFVSAFARLPSPATLFVARARPMAPFRSFNRFLRLDSEIWQPPLNHVASLATLQQAIFVPTTYADPAQQPIVVTSRYAAIYTFQGRDPLRVRNAEEFTALTEQIRRLVKDMALPPVPIFLLVLYPEFLLLPVPPGTAVVEAGAHFLILRVSP